MIGTINIKDNETLRQLLTLLTFMPDAVQIPERVFCKVPQSDYTSKLDPSLGDGRKTMNSQFNAFYEDVESAWVLVGENTDDYGEVASGSRNLVDNPVTKEEMVAWVEKYKPDSFSLDFPRTEGLDEQDTKA